MSKKKTYIYHLDFDIRKNITRLLDHDDDWKELAERMKYSAFDIDEIKVESDRRQISPTSHLFSRWGQHNHTVEELFILLYEMRYIPALKLLLPIVDVKFHQLLQQRLEKMKISLTLDENANKEYTQEDESQSFIPLPVRLMEQGGKLPSSSKETTQSSTGSIGTSSTGYETNDSEKKTNHGNQEYLQIPMHTYEQLKEATNNWSDSNLLGRGGFGQVYKGSLGESKVHPVAIKKLLRDDEGNKELIREMGLNKYRHDNILPLYGYSLGGPEVCLVYQLMMGGSLEQRLRSKSPQLTLSWKQRYNIAYGVARGLVYLHTMDESPVIHGDIKPANILLDQCTMPKIGDFGLARKGINDRNLKVSKVHGTEPYLPREFIDSHSLSPAVDVFSYGVVMLEIATALFPLDKSREKPFLYAHLQDYYNQGGDLASLEDSRIKESNPVLCREFVTIGLHCTKNKGGERPTMIEVYRKLDAMAAH